MPLGSICLPIIVPILLPSAAVPSRSNGIMLLIARSRMARALLQLAHHRPLQCSRDILL